MNPKADESAMYAARAMQHIEKLAGEIGARPSTQNGERLAAEYSARVLNECGLKMVRVEKFSSAASSYRPFLVAFCVALSGNFIHQMRPRRQTSLLAMIANFSAAWGFARESSLQNNWMRRVLPTAPSQNVIGVVEARGEVLRRVVVYGHLDSHRTPLVYSSPRWLHWFSRIVSLAFLSLVVGAGAHALMASHPKISKNKWLRAINFGGALVQAFCAALLIEADTTEYSPGANDNASGAATMLALAERVAKNPLQNTEVWFAGTGCEEVGCYGIEALLKAHESTLRDAFFLDFDMVGIGNPAILTREGLLNPSRPDAELLNLAREVAAQTSELKIEEHDGGAYTDTGMVTSRGFRGLTIDSIRPPHHPAEKYSGYWHQREDTSDKIEVECLRKTHVFGWEILQRIDRF